MSAPHTDLFGVLARYDSPASLIAAARSMREAGYRRFECYSPFPVHGLPEAIGFRSSRLPTLVLLGGIVGCVVGYGFQYWVSAIAYPLNIGGRPLNSWPSFVPVMFEMTVLVAALAAVLGMLALNGLPRPHHPLFGVESFARATRDGFFLCVLADDPQFDKDAVREILVAHEAGEVIDVPQ
ncbi:MAG: DUF3341 domain-containing protein [Pirellulaceae bacterium]